VLAIGNPFGIGQTVTRGIVRPWAAALWNQVARSFGEDVSEFHPDDAASIEGNSGGALVDAAGRLIGITTPL